MFKNQLHPVTIFSCFVLAISFMSLGIAFQVISERVNRYDYALEDAGFSLSNISWEELLGILVFLGIGAFLMTAALGLMFYKKWARYLMQFGFVLVGVVWLVFLTYNSYQVQNAPFVFSGITATVLGCVIGSLLFLNNTEWVLPHFRNHDDSSGNVLDQDFTYQSKKDA